MNIKATIPIHRDWTKTQEFDAAPGLEGAVLRRIEGVLSGIQETVAGEWPELLSIYADVWLTDVEGSEEADFRFFKKNGQLVINFSVDCNALCSADLHKQSETVVVGLVNALAIAFAKYRRKRSCAKTLELGEARSADCVFLETGPSHGEEQSTECWLIEVTLAEGTLGNRGEPGLDLLEGLSNRVVASRLAEYEGVSFGAGTVEVGFLSPKPDEVTAMIHAFMTSVGIQHDQYSVHVDEN